MVRDDGPKAAAGVRELVPQSVLVRQRADRRAALVARVAVGDAVGREPEVVEARLGRDVDAAPARLAQHRDALSRREVDDVQVELRRKAGQRQDLGHGARLEGGRTGVQEGAVAGAGLCSSRRGVLRVTGGEHLGVEHERRGRLLERRHGQRDVLCRYGRELVHLFRLLSWD